MSTRSPRTSSEPGARGVIARGLGRAYGDAAQNAGGLVLDTTNTGATTGIRVVDGTVTVPAGTSLDALMAEVVPQGYFLPVSPGTRFVTIGGAIAADVHGKNHHIDGSFANHVRSLRLAVPGGKVLDIGPGDDQQPELFWATAGGMGLTGVILDATIALPRIETSLLLVDTDRVRRPRHGDGADGGRATIATTTPSRGWISWPPAVRWDVPS